MKLLPVITAIIAVASQAHSNDLLSHYIIPEKTIGPTPTTAPGVFPSVEVASFTNATTQVMVVVRSELAIYRGDDLNNNYFWLQLLAMRPSRQSPDARQTWMNQIMRTPADFLIPQPELIVNIESLEPDGVQLNPGEELCVMAGSPVGKTRVTALVWYYLQ